MFFLNRGQHPPAFLPLPNISFAVWCAGPNQDQTPQIRSRIQLKGRQYLDDEKSIDELIYNASHVNYRPKSKPHVSRTCRQPWIEGTSRTGPMRRPLVPLNGTFLSTWAFNDSYITPTYTLLIEKKWARTETYGQTGGQRNGMDKGRWSYTSRRLICPAEYLKTTATILEF
jgi:hypothetical protein